MPGTVSGPVNPAFLANAPQAAFLTSPQGADPAVNASSGQLYQKGNAVFFQDTTGAVTNVLAGSQAVANALAGVTTTFPYGCFNATGPLTLNSGASQNITKGWVASASGSVIGAFFLGAAANAVSGALQVYKNGSLFFTAISNANFPGGNGSSGPLSAQFANGTYPFVRNDYFDAYYTGSGSGIYIGVGLTFVQGNAFANTLSTVLSANSTVAATDNQRVWLASLSTQYTLTLPATQATQDFYVRVAVTGSGGIKIQAPTGVTIYRGTSSSSAGGSFTVTQLGTYVTLYNPANSSVWIVMDQSAAGTFA